MKNFEIKCPDCNTILIVDRLNGKILEVRKPLLEESESTGDRFEDARKRVESSGDRVNEKVEEVKRAQKEKMAKLDALFSERKKEIEDSGEPVEKPDSVFGPD